MNSAYGVSAISEETIEFASPGIDVQDLPHRGSSITLRSPGSNDVRTRISFRAFNSGPFPGAFDGVSINDPYHGGATDSACASNAMPLTLERGCGQRGQHVAQHSSGWADNCGHRHGNRDGARGEHRSPWSQGPDIEPSTHVYEISQAIATKSGRKSTGVILRTRLAQG